MKKKYFERETISTHPGLRLATILYKKDGR